MAKAFYQNYTHTETRWNTQSHLTAAFSIQIKRGGGGGGLVSVCVCVYNTWWWSPGVVLKDIQGVRVQEQSAPGEEAASRQHTYVWTRPRILRYLEVDHHLLWVYQQPIVLNPVWQSPARGQSSQRVYLLWWRQWADIYYTCITIHDLAVPLYTTWPLSLFFAHRLCTNVTWQKLSAVWLYCHLMSNQVS